MAFRAGNPFADLPAPEPLAPAPAVPPAESASVKRKRETGLPEGWRKVPSQSKPGTYSHENVYTKERIKWLPDRPASRQPKQLPPAPQRPKPDPSLDGEAKKAHDAQKLSEALVRLKGHLLAEDSGKFVTCCKGLHKSLFSSSAFSADNTNLYFECLEASQSRPERVWAPENRKYTRLVFEEVAKKRDIFPVEQAYKLETWGMRAVLHSRLFTDDTYQHAAALKAFTAALEEIERGSKRQIVELEGLASAAEYTGRYAQGSALDLEERKRVIVEAAETAVATAGGWQWKVSGTTALLRTLADRRQLFCEALQGRIDAATEAFARRGSKAAKQATDRTGAMQGRIIPKQKKFG